MTHQFSLKTLNGWMFIVALLGLVAGLTLTTISWLELCIEACAEVHNYRFFGYSFELLGFVIFSVLILTHVFSLRYPLLGTLTALGLAASVGSEINFIRVQKYVIGQWCPVCLTIALCVGVAALAYFVSGLRQTFIDAKRTNQGVFTMFIKRAVPSMIMIVIGFIIAFFGVFKPEKSFAQGLEAGDPIFGDKNSSIEVYVITDWFCGGCRKMEPKMHSAWPKIMERARLFFIDFPIHAETKNFMPYNLSFMIYEKEKYFDLRSVLHKLAERTKKPKVKEIRKAIKPLGVVYEPLDFEDIDSGRKFFDGIVKAFEIKMTPTVVVANRRSLQSIKIEGSENINENSVMNAIEELSR